ncbi:hypothetical protein ACJX0J_007709 [Zea mays]
MVFHRVDHADCFPELKMKILHTAWVVAENTVNLGKRASVEIHGINDPPRNDDEALDEDPIPNFRLGDVLPLGLICSLPTQTLSLIVKKCSCCAHITSLWKTIGVCYAYRCF